MSEIDNLGQGPAPLNPTDRKLYEQEYKQGVDLFQRSLIEYGKADEVHKKEAFKDVMTQAMQILNETARELKRADLNDQNKKISKDLVAYEDNETDVSKGQLMQDLNQAKKIV